MHSHDDAYGARAITMVIGIMFDPRFIKFRFFVNADKLYKTIKNIFFKFTRCLK